MISYLDHVDFGFLACRELVPDVDDLAARPRGARRAHEGRRRLTSMTSSRASSKSQVSRVPVGRAAADEPLVAERLAERVERHREEERVGRDLARVRGHRGALAVDEVAHVDGRGDDALGDAEPEVVHRRRRRARPVASASSSARCSIRRWMWSRFIVASYTRRRARELGGADADAVHLDVVGVAVAAVVVVDGQHVGVLVVRGSRRAAPRPRRRRRCGERLRRVVRRLAGHAGVVVAEELDPVDAERSRGRASVSATRRSPSVSPGREASGRCSPSSPRSRPRARPGGPRPWRGPSCRRSRSPRRRDGRGRSRVCGRTRRAS